jgi:hypothetical protein
VGGCAVLAGEIRSPEGAEGGQETRTSWIIKAVMLIVLDALH